MKTAVDDMLWFSRRISFLLLRKRKRDTVLYKDYDNMIWKSNNEPLVSYFSVATF